MPAGHRLINGIHCQSRWAKRYRSPCHDRVHGTVVHAGGHMARSLAPKISLRPAHIMHES